MSTDDMSTKPTIDTILERIDAFRKSVESRFDNIDARVEVIEKDIAAFRESVDDRLDEIEKSTSRTRMDVLKLRGDFREWRGLLKEQLPDLK